MSWGKHHKPSCFMRGVYRTGAEYIFCLFINPQMRNALREFAELNKRKEEKIRWPSGFSRNAIFNLIDRIKDQLDWIDDQRRRNTNYEFDPNRSAFWTTGANGRPYVILFTGTERFRDLFDEDDPYTVQKTLLHFDTQCSLIDEQVQKREEKYRQEEDEAEVAFADSGAVAHE